MKETYLLRLQSGKLSKLKKVAKSMNCALNQMINHALEQFLGNSLTNTFYFSSFYPRGNRVLFFSLIIHITVKGKLYCLDVNNFERMRHLNEKYRHLLTCTIFGKQMFRLALIYRC